MTPTPFIAFWRLLDGELHRLGLLHARAGEALSVASLEPAEAARCLGWWRLLLTPRAA